MQNCYSKAKVPPLLAEQDDRLTAKHIKALSFLQDIGTENKTLKIKVKELEEKLSKCQKEHSKLAARSPCAEVEQANQLLQAQIKDLMQKVEEKAEAEKQWETERMKLLAELGKSKKEKDALTNQLESFKKDARVPELESRVNGLEEDVELLREQKAHLEQVNGYQLAEIERLQRVGDHNDHLREQLNESQQKAKELEFKVGRLEREMSEGGQTEQDELMGTLRNKLTLLHKEKSLWTTKNRDYEAEITALREEIARLRRALSDSECMRGDLQEQIEELVRELNALRKRLASENNGQAFKDFVQLKRELSTLKDENVELKSRLKGKSATPVLPSLRQNGAAHSGRADRRAREHTSLSLMGKR